MSVFKPQRRRFNWRSFGRSLLFVMGIPGLAFVAQELPQTDLLSEPIALFVSLLIGQVLRAIDGGVGTRG